LSDRGVFKATTALQHGSTRLSDSAPAATAHAEDLDCVCNRGEAVAPSHSANPFDLGGFYLDRPTAPPAHKMMMMIVGLAQSVEGLTLGRCNDVNLSGIGMGLQIPIDGRQPTAAAAWCSWSSGFRIPVPPASLGGWLHDNDCQVQHGSDEQATTLDEHRSID
jgi:hypothetical protein